MKRLVSMVVFAGYVSVALGAAGVGQKPDVERAKQLKDFIRKEKPHFEERESQRRVTLEELDRLNSDQNRVRERMGGIVDNQRELSMALDNLSVEVQKQRQLEQMQKQRLITLLKIVYKIKRDGVLRFLVMGDDLSKLAGRVRILYRTLRSHTSITRALGERTNRLAESERKLEQAKVALQRLYDELNEQEMLLNSYLDKKKRVLRAIAQKQTNFQAAVKEYRQISKQIATLFTNFETLRDSGRQPGTADAAFPNRGSLPLPITAGTVVSNFGRSVHKSFQTVTYHKGIEIEAEQNAPVTAIMAGVVEFEGWVKGLGNVIILHHGNGFYTLSAHLFKTLQARGARVGQGDPIGLVGDTGANEKSSLYFEIRENGKAVEPLTYFSPNALASLH